MMKLEDFNLDNFVTQKKHDVYVLEAIKEAIVAANEGNFGIGAVLAEKKPEKSL